jgi:hypothetical protein
MNTDEKQKDFKASNFYAGSIQDYDFNSFGLSVFICVHPWFRS